MRFCGCHGSAGLELTTWQAPGGAGQRQVRGLNLCQIIFNSVAYKPGICRLEGNAPSPCGLTGTVHISVIVTEEEISIVCCEELIPGSCLSERGFRAIRIKGPLDFFLIGILPSLLTLLLQRRSARLPFLPTIQTIF